MAQENQEIDIRAWVIRILKNWYWFAISCAIVGVIGVCSYLSTTKKFMVDAEVVLQQSDAKMVLPQAELMSMLGVGGGSPVADEILVMSSRDLITQVVTDLDLQTEYRKKDGLRWVGQYPGRDLSVVYPVAFLDTTQRTVEMSIKVRKNDYLVYVKYGRFNTSKHKVKDLTVPFETCATTLSFNVHKTDGFEEGDCYRIITTPLLSSVKAYRNAIQVSKTKKEANVISFSTQTDMPSRACNFIRRQIELYNEWSVSDKNLMANNTAIFLDERLALMEQELIEAEQKEVEYKERYGIVSLEEEVGLYVQENVESRKQLTEVETQLNLVQFVAEFVADEKNKDQLIPANLGITDPALVALVAEYNKLMLDKMRIERTATIGNPILIQMTEQLSLLRSNVLATILNVRETLTITKSDLEARLQVAEVWRDDAPIQLKQYRELVRMKLLKERLYLFLYQKREENSLSLVAAIPPAKLIAVPQLDPYPLSPNWKYYALVCLFLGMAFPMGIMVLREMLNTRVTDTPKDLENKLKVALAGVLVNDKKGDIVVVRDGEVSMASEFVRTLRTNLRFMQPVDVKSPVVLVTSSVNGEGKSYVATNLAVSMALLGKKVALVGLDLRKPTLATYLNLPSQGCLTNYLSDKAYALEDVVVASSVKNLDVLPAGAVPPNPSELLQSDRLAVLFAELRERYDYIVVDSAPIALVSDTFLLSGMADMTVCVVRANHTTFDMVDFINKTQEQERLPKMVAVLNGVDANKVGYGY